MSAILFIFFTMAMGMSVFPREKLCEAGISLSFGDIALLFRLQHISSIAKIDWEERV